VSITNYRRAALIRAMNVGYSVTGLHDKVIDLMKAIRGLLREINIEAKAKG
jgi:hypothetical protein